MNMLNESNIDVKLHKTLIDHIELLYDRGAYEQAINLATKLAYLESLQYIGYLSSIRIEETLSKIGAKLFPISNYKSNIGSKRKVLHIGTKFYTIGGHTKVAMDWIKNDKYSESELLVINQQQKNVNLPKNITTHYLKSTNILERATQLRQFVEDRYYDVIVLHQHMDDVVTTLALWDIKEKSETLVLFYNHSNFRFSLGNIIAHKRVNICEGDVRISEKYRYPLEEEVLHFILGETLTSELPIQLAESYKSKLKIKNDQKVLFSIGSAYKYTPFQDQNFLKEWNEFLSTHPNCLLILIGCDETDFKKYCPNIIKADNLILLGIVENPLVYYQIADYIVDAYPLQTGLGTLNGLYYGLPPILPYKETAMVLGKEINKLYPNAIVEYLSYSNQTEYFIFIENEIKSNAYKKWATPIIEKYVNDKLLLKSWQIQLEKIYRKKPQPVKYFDKTKDILNLSVPSQNWHQFTTTTDRSLNLVTLAIKYRIPPTFSLLSIYFNVITKQDKLSRTILRKIYHYFSEIYNGILMKIKNKSAAN